MGKNYQKKTAMALKTPNIVSLVLLYFSYQHGGMQRLWTPITRAAGFDMSCWVVVLFLFVFCKIMNHRDDHTSFYVFMLMAVVANVEHTEIAWWYLTAHVICNTPQISDNIPTGYRSQIIGVISDIWAWSQLIIMCNAAKQGMIPFFK